MIKKVDEIRKVKKYSISYILMDFFIIGVFFFIIYLELKSPHSLGGSNIFVITSGVVVYLSIVYREFHSEINLILWLLFLLTVMNYIAYMESIKGFSLNVVFFSSALAILISATTSSMIIKPFGPKEIKGVSSLLKIEIRKRVTGMVDSGIIAMTLGYLTISIALFFALFQKVPPIKVPLMFSSIVIFWLTCILGVSFIRGKRVPEDYVNYLVNKKSVRNINLLKKKLFIYVLIGIFCLGMVLETTRGLWLMWILSWLTFLIAIMAIWTTWKHVFSDKKVNVDNLKPGILTDIHNPIFFLKYTGIHFFVGIIYCLIFIFFWYFYWK